MNKVASGKIELTYSIFAHDYDDGNTVYDWALSSGETSDYVFDSIQEAEQDVRRKF